MAATATFLGHFESSTDLTTYTFPSCDFGPASADRYIVAVATNRQTTSRTYVSSTIGGIAGTTVVPNVNSGLDNGAMVIAKVPTGTTGQTVTITWSGAAARCGIALWALTGISGPTPADTTSSTASPPTSSTLDVPVDGCLIVGAFSAANTTSSPTGYSEDYDALVESANTHSGGHENLPAGATNRTITTTFGTHTNPLMLAASFAPARSISEDPGSYAIAGSDASLEFGYELTADGGSFSLSGADATLTYAPSGIFIVADGGSFSLTGSDANLELGREIIASSGTFSITGSSAQLEYARLLIAQSGAYAITGSDATLTAPIVPPPFIRARTGVTSAKGRGTAIAVKARIGITSANSKVTIQ